MSLSAISHFLISISAGINPTCDFYQELTIGKEYYINNLEYPNNYGFFSRCRWIGKSPLNSQIVITCDVNIPYSRNCRRDHLAISLTGNSRLRDARRFCGPTRRTVISQNNSLSIGLFPSSGSPGGTFECILTAVKTKPSSPAPTRPNICNCGWTYEAKIVGGQNSKPNKYPSMAVIVDKSTNESFCGASIISEKYALTAAHCLNQKEPEELLLLVGDYDLTVADNTSVYYSITRILKHPQYNDTTHHNDIAVLEMTKPIVFTPYIGPVCLPFRYSEDDFYAQTVTALGWGFLDFSGNKANILQEVDLSIVSNTDCAAVIPNPISDQQICTYAPDKDACLSDSGGPLLWQDSKTRHLQLIGIISYGIGCATIKPAVNIRVTSYLSWIVDVTKGEFYCIK